MIVKDLNHGNFTATINGKKELVKNPQLANKHWKTGLRQTITLQEWEELDRPRTDCIAAVGRNKGTDPYAYEDGLENVLGQRTVTDGGNYGGN